MKFDTSGGTEAPPKWVVWDEGDYLFEVVEAEEAESKAGNPMVVVNLKFYDGEKTTKVRDYLTATAAWKIKQLLVALGMPEAAETGELDPEAIQGKGGMAHLNVEEYNGKENNKVGLYVDPDEEPAEAPRKAIGEDPDEDPFS